MCHEISFLFCVTKRQSCQIYEFVTHKTSAHSGTAALYSFKLHGSKYTMSIYHSSDKAKSIPRPSC